VLLLEEQQHAKTCVTERRHGNLARISTILQQQFSEELNNHILQNVWFFLKPFSFGKCELAIEALDVEILREKRP
jgi:hypothetical protein